MSYLLLIPRIAGRKGRAAARRMFLCVVSQSVSQLLSISFALRSSRSFPIRSGKRSDRTLVSYVCMCLYHIMDCKIYRTVPYREAPMHAHTYPNAGIVLCIHSTLPLYSTSTVLYCTSIPSHRSTSCTAADLPCALGIAHSAPIW